jgi:hypothetical protein
MINIIKKWWATARMSPLEKYLANSSDLHDLEYRCKQMMKKGYYQ